MNGELSELAQEYFEKKQELDEKEQELSDLRSNLFTTDSEEIEEKARSLFDNVGSNNTNGKSQEIDSLEQEIEKLEQEVGELEEDIQYELIEVSFPFDETIDQREEEEVAFPFTNPIPEEVIRAIDEVIRNDLNGESVELRPEEIVVLTDDVSEAISSVEDFANDLRDTARHELNTDEYVEKLATRDVKIQRMLYELYESSEPLAKIELEERSEVGKGGLRGVLYSVHDNDPYLVKKDKKFHLSEIGESVMDKFSNKFDKPEVPDEGNDKTESNGGDQDGKDSQMTLEQGGDKDE